MYTKKQCQKKLFQLGLKYGVSPRLISTKLLSEQDKHDMLAGILSDEALDESVKVWVAGRAPDLSNH